MAYRVLIVDDSPAMRSFVRRIMEISGFDVASCLEALDGTEALEVLKTEWVDAILSDINMPRMDGEELLRRLEADESLRRIPVIVISTDGTGSSGTYACIGSARLREETIPSGRSESGTPT